MIPLGSCTMKLNATTEMVAITRPEFANLHPFAPTSQTEGIRSLVGDLSAWLCEITGYDAVSLQPNAGSQGELAGLLAIHAYHQANGETAGYASSPPASAGTNAASAVMAGLRSSSSAPTRPAATSTWTTCGPRSSSTRRPGGGHGHVPVDARRLRGHHRGALRLVHDAGGQVYVDGANLNAIMGLAQPGKFGADVSHLNLHKTFCIPHGGGGPGVGPVGVRAHLAPYLPNHPLAPEAGPATGVGPISGALYGSAGILPISAYVRLMGGVG